MSSIILKQVDIQNIKQITKLTEEFTSGNIYLVRGGNEKGKTTFLNAIMSLLGKNEDADVMIQSGKTSGLIRGKFDKDGKEIQVILEYSVGKKRKLSIIFPDGTESSKVDDLKKLFAYQHVTAEEYIELSETKDGRRKQRDILLSLLSDGNRAAYNVACEQYELKYKERTEIGRQLDTLESMMIGVALTEEEEAQLSKKENIIKQLAKLEEEKSVIKTAVDTKNAKIQQRDMYLESIESKKKEIQQMKDEIEAAQKAIALNEQLIKEQETLIDEITSEISDVDEAKLEALSIRINNGRALRDKIISLESKSKLASENVTKLKELKESKEDLTKRLDKLQETKKNIISLVDMPVKGLSIDDDGLTYNGLPFNKNQIATSVSMEVAIGILLAINKNTPIITIGRAESFDDSKIENLNKLAKERNCEFFLERVIGNKDTNLSIDIYED